MAKRISKIRELLKEDAELKKVDEKDIEKLEAELEKELKAEAEEKMPEDSDKEEVKEEDSEEEEKKDEVKECDAEEKKEKEDVKKESVEVEKPTMNIEEHMTALFNGETLTEDFQKKARTIFEAAVREKVVQYATTLKQRYNNRLVAAKAKIEEKLVAKVDSYMDYVVEEWMEQNKLAVEHGLRTEITEEFLTDLRNLFETHNIMIPKGKENLVESLSSKVEKLEKDLNDQTKKTMTLHKKLNEYKKTETFRQICEGLADTEIEKLKSLASSLEYDESYKEKLTVIKENYFSQKAKKADPIEEVAEKKPETEKKMEVNENMASYLNVMKKIRQ